MTGADTRALNDAERHAREALRQIDHLRRNGPGDVIRFGLIANELWYAWRAAARADKRNCRVHGWHWWGFRLPRGYQPGGRP